jgi:hypothetical protein
VNAPLMIKKPMDDRLTAESRLGEKWKVKNFDVSEIDLPEVLFSK